MVSVKSQAVLKQATPPLVSAMAHELRTPLSIISGLSDMLKAETFGALNSRQREQLRQISRATARAELLIDGVTHVDKLSNMAVDRQPLAMRAELDRALEVVAEQAAARDITLEVRMRRLPPVTGQAGSLQRLFRHLCGFIIRQSPAGSLITISGKRSREQLLIVLSYQGEEIKPGELRALSRRLGRRQPLPGRSSAAGLDLYLAHAIALAHGGGLSTATHSGQPQLQVRLPLLKQLRLFE